MRFALLALAAALLIAAGTGCHHHNLSRHGCSCSSCGHENGHGHGRHGCSNCGHGGCQGCGNPHDGISDYGNNPRVPRLDRYEEEYYSPGPQMPQYAYPYYTVRAPRDFLMDNPPTIGY